VTDARPRLPLFAVVAAAVIGGALAWWSVGGDPCAGASLESLQARSPRSAIEHRCLGRLHSDAGRDQAAIDAYLQALDGGEHDDVMLAFAVRQAALTPHGRALALLERWPDPEVDALLIDALAREWPLRANALDVLERRGQATDAHRRQVAEREAADATARGPRP
jgi:hypothetical protein